MSDKPVKGFPKAVRIGAFNYKVEYPSFIVSDESTYRVEFSMGHWARDQQKIRVKQMPSRQRMAETLLHEILHGMFYEAGLYEHEDLVKHEEVIVDRLSKQWTTLIAANPGLMGKIEEIIAEQG